MADMESIAIKLRIKICRNIRCYNKNIKDGYLDKFSMQELLTMTHTEDRSNFERQINILF